MKTVVTLIVLILLVFGGITTVSAQDNTRKAAATRVEEMLVSNSIAIDKGRGDLWVCEVGDKSISWFPTPNRKGYVLLAARVDPTAKIARTVIMQPKDLPNFRVIVYISTKDSVKWFRNAFAKLGVQYPESLQLKKDVDRCLRGR